MNRIYRIPRPGTARDRLRDALTQRYVMGLLGPTARRAFHAWLSQDARLQAQVREWEHTLAQLSMHVPHLAPSPALWRRIQAELPPVGKPADAQRKAWWQLLLDATATRLVGAAATGAFACAMVVSLIPAADVDGVPASYVGVLADARDEPGLVVASLRHGRQVQIKLVKPIAVSEGLAPVLWALAPGEAPRAVARLPASGKANLAIDSPAEKAFQRVTRLAVSLEPTDGAANAPLPAQPSRPFILTGHCAKVW